MILLLQTESMIGQGEFYSYHTKRVHTSTDYFGKFADLVVVVGDKGQLEFTRQNQYLPTWITENGSFAIDDFFPGRDPDYQFQYNYVRLLEQSKDSIVIHWRYIPDIRALEEANHAVDPTTAEGFLSVVHEFFTIYPTGLINRKVMDARGSRFKSWCHPEYGDQQDLQLNNDGITHGSVQWGNKSDVLNEEVIAAPLVDVQELYHPKLRWSFDEGGDAYPPAMEEEMRERLQWEPDALEGQTIEAINKTFHKILGHSSLYKSGVSGTSLGFDGYYTGVEMPKIVQQAGTTYFDEKQGQLFEEKITIEGWLALDVYPYNEAPIVHQSKNFGEQGFYFGIDPHGKLFFRVNGQTVVSAKNIPLYKWVHVACTYGNDQLSIFLNGNIFQYH